MLINERVLEKLEIGRVYWKRRNIDWEIAIFKHLLAKKIIFTNLLEPININKKLELKVSENLMHKEFNIS